MNTIWSTYVQSIGTLYNTRSLRFSDIFMDKFKYSNELEELFLQFIQTSDFSKKIVNNELKIKIAKIVIGLFHNRIDEAKKAYSHAVEIYSSSYESKLQKILDKHKYKDTLKITLDAKEFLETIKF